MCRSTAGLLIGITQFILSGKTVSLSMIDKAPVSRQGDMQHDLMYFATDRMVFLE